MSLLTVISFLIAVCVLAIIFYLILWVLQIVGVPVPAKVIQLLWVIFALIVIYYLVQMFLGSGGALRLPPLR